jgi:hypothetical protein
MALNFPNDPVDGQIETLENSAQYRYSVATQSWIVVGAAAGQGTVNSVNITGSNGIDTSGDIPITDIGTINIAFNIDGVDGLPSLP